MRWLVTIEYEHHYKPALVAKSQLEEVGFKVDLQVSDWATVVSRRNKPELWDVFSTAFVFNPEPTIAAQILCEWPGWWCSPEKEQLLATLTREVDVKKRQAVIEKMQALFYADHDLKAEEAYTHATKEYAVRHDIYGADALAWTALKAGRLLEAQAAIGADEDTVADRDVSHRAAHLASDHDAAVAVQHGAVGDGDVLTRLELLAAVFLRSGLDRHAVVANVDVAIGDVNVSAGVRIDATRW